MDEGHEVAIGGEFGDGAAGPALAVDGVETAIEHDGWNFGGYGALDHGENVQTLFAAVDFLDHEVVARRGAFHSRRVDRQLKATMFHLG